LKVMGRGSQTFKQQDVTRAIKGARLADLEIARVEIDGTGKIIIIAGKPDPMCGTPEPNKGADEWE